MMPSQASNQKSGFSPIDQPVSLKPIFEAGCMSQEMFVSLVRKSYRSGAKGVDQLRVSVSVQLTNERTSHAFWIICCFDGTLLNQVKMPEGPSLVIAKEQIIPFVGQSITGVEGNAGAPIQTLLSEHILDIHTWGKVLLIETENWVIRIHFLMFGSYSINEQTKPVARLRLKLDTPMGSIFFYTCSVRVLPPEELLSYDWEADVLDDSWNDASAKKKLKSEPDILVCDALLDQQIFSGVGNIIKNEVLYRIKVHPETMVKNLPPRILNQLIAEARNYSFDFLKWKRAYVLRKHWLAHTKKICTRCNLPIIKKYCGVTQRRTFFCQQCQVLYS